jgi:hypothetical protein
LNFSFYNSIMARIFDPIYDPRQDSGSSGSEISDLNPERAYDTDLRRIEEDERGDVEAINDKQERVGRFIKAAKTAGKYKQQASIAEPTIRGETPQNPASIAGSEVPSKGDTFPQAGSTNYARKPGVNFGTFYGY